MADGEAAGRVKAGGVGENDRAKVLCELFFKYEIAHNQREMKREQVCSQLRSLSRLADSLSEDEWRLPPASQLTGFDS